MAAPKQARTPGPAARSGAKGRDKGTRGGRPEAQPSAAVARRQGGQAVARQGRPGAAQRLERTRPGGQLATGRQPAAAGADDVRAGAPRWLQLTTLALSVIGLGISIYLTIAHFTSTAVLACSDKGVINCAAVTTSPESEVFGIFPVAVLGLAFYVFAVGINTPWAWRAKWPVVGWARIASLITGMGFVLYLIYTELFTLGQICLWCTGVHVVTFLLFGLIMFAVAAGYGTSRARPGH
jgi:uncharacterized membrane protein